MHNTIIGDSNNPKEIKGFGYYYITEYAPCYCWYDEEEDDMTDYYGYDFAEDKEND